MHLSSSKLALASPIHGLRTALQKPGALFVFCFAYFLCSELFWTSSFLYNLGFYALLLPAFLYAWRREPELVSALPRDFGTRALAVFFLFVALHALLWREDGRTVRTLCDTLLNGLFVLMALAVFHWRETEPLRLLRILVPVATLCGVVSIALFFLHGAPDDRLVPIGRAHNPIPGANVYAVSALVAAFLFLQPPLERGWKYRTAICVALVTLMVLLTGSRGPLLSLGIGYGLLLLLERQWKWIGAGALPGLLLVGDYGYYATHGSSLLHAQAVYAHIQGFFEGRDSYRLEIWRKTLGLIAERPWQGYGMQAKFFLEGAEGAVNPHNIFLATAYYTGLPGLALLLLPLGAAFVAACKRLKQPYYRLVLVLLVHGVAACFTDLAQVVKAPSALWSIYWLPIALALARPQKVSVGQA